MNNTFQICPACACETLEVYRSPRMSYDNCWSCGYIMNYPEKHNNSGEEVRKVTSIVKHIPVTCWNEIDNKTMLDAPDSAINHLSRDGTPMYNIMSQGGKIYIVTTQQRGEL